jgi:hypothetical protein
LNSLLWRTHSSSHSCLNFSALGGASERHTLPSSRSGQWCKRAACFALDSAPAWRCPHDRKKGWCRHHCASRFLAPVSDSRGLTRRPNYLRRLTGFVGTLYRRCNRVTGQLCCTPQQHSAYCSRDAPLHNGVCRLQPRRRHAHPCRRVSSNSSDSGRHATESHNNGVCGSSSHAGARFTTRHATASRACAVKQQAQGVGC